MLQENSQGIGRADLVQSSCWLNGVANLHKFSASHKVDERFRRHAIISLTSLIDGCTLHVKNNRWEMEACREARYLSDDSGQTEPDISRQLNRRPREDTMAAYSYKEVLK